MKFDIVITTYNRAEKVSSLVKSLLTFSGDPAMGKIIVVDSSDKTLGNDEIKNNSSVVIIRSSHKNQPYQRLVGSVASRADYILFLDDDMEIIDASFVPEFQELMKKGYAGVNLLFKK